MTTVATQLEPPATTATEPAGRDQPTTIGQHLTDLAGPPTNTVAYAHRLIDALRHDTARGGR